MGDLLGSGPSVEYKNAKIQPETSYETATRENLTGLLGSMATSGLAGYNKNLLLGDSLSRGEIPQSFMNNFQSGIGRTVHNTMGSAINNLAGRGVINSSVMEKANNDIINSTADASAQNWLNSWQALAGLYNTNNTVSQGGINNLTDLYKTWYGGRMSMSTPGQYVVNPGSPGLLGPLATVGSAMVGVPMGGAGMFGGASMAGML